MKRFLLLIALAIFLFNLPAVRVLSISNRKNLSEKVYSKSAAERGFVVSYTHSVNKGRVHDFYRVLPRGELELYKTQFVSYGAGIPEASDTEGAQFRVGKDGYLIEDLHRILPELVMAVGVIAEHSIAVGEDVSAAQEVFLTDFFAPQTSLLFEVRRVSVPGYLRARKF